MAILYIHSNLIPNPNLGKSHASRTFISIAKSSWKFVQITAVVLTCSEWQSSFAITWSDTLHVTSKVNEQDTHKILNSQQMGCTGTTLKLIPKLISSIALRDMISTSTLPGKNDMSCLIVLIKCSVVLDRCRNRSYSDATWVSWPLKPPTTGLFDQQLFQGHSTTTPKYRMSGPWWGRSTGLPWIPFAMGKEYEKCLYIIKSSWNNIWYTSHWGHSRRHQS